jgi:hypothetical protein
LRPPAELASLVSLKMAKEMGLLPPNATPET